MKVTMEPYDPAWAVKFLQIRAQLSIILASIPIVSIEHVGSTSISGLCAKPVIDVDIIISETSLVAARAALASAGYVDCGELNVPGRYVFREPGYGQSDAAHGRQPNGEPRQNTYLCIQDCPSLRNHLDVRRVLGEGHDLRDEYGLVKAQAVHEEFENIGQYVAKKTVILCKILKEAGWSEDELQPIREINK